jgi:hypothetical protein
MKKTRHKNKEKRGVKTIKDEQKKNASIVRQHTYYPIVSRIIRAIQHPMHGIFNYKTLVN